MKQSQKNVLPRLLTSINYYPSNNKKYKKSNLSIYYLLKICGCLPWKEKNYNKIDDVDNCHFH